MGEHKRDKAESLGGTAVGIRDIQRNGCYENKITTICKQHMTQLRMGITTAWSYTDTCISEICV